MSLTLVGQAWISSGDKQEASFSDAQTLLSGHNRCIEAAAHQPDMFNQVLFENILQAQEIITKFDQQR